MTGQPVRPDQLRVWWLAQLPVVMGAEAFIVPVQSIIEAKKVIEVIADYDNYLVAAGAKADHSNAAGLEVYKDGDWEEWEDENGNDINEVEL